MLNGLTGVDIGQISAGTLVVLVVLLILTGRLVPRSQITDLTKDRDTWRAAADEWQRTATQQGMTLEKLLVHAETDTHVLAELQQAAQQRNNRDRAQNR